MDVPPLQSSTLQRPDAAGGGVGPGRARRTAGASGATSGVPAPLTNDRLERTPELEQKLASLRQALDRAPDPNPVDLDALREEITRSRLNTRDTLLRAADGILLGELYFQQQA
ncbi:MAG: hypothetical protein FJ293_02490 [Planctomycetes bacterium]|nr:hypothetical protein [Planctomycetota bacterium]